MRFRKTWMAGTSPAMTSAEHLHLAVERHQAGLDAELRVAPGDFLAEPCERGRMGLGLDLRGGHLGCTVGDLGRAAVAMIDGDHLLDVVQLNRGAEIVVEGLVPALEGRC